MTPSFEILKRALIETGDPFFVLVVQDAFVTLAERCRHPSNDRRETRLERGMRLNIGRDVKEYARIIKEEVWPATVVSGHAKMKDPPLMEPKESINVQDTRPPAIRRQSGRRRRSPGGSSSPGSTASG